MTNIPSLKSLVTDCALTWLVHPLIWTHSFSTIIGHKIPMKPIALLQGRAKKPLTARYSGHHFSTCLHNSILVANQESIICDLWAYMCVCVCADNLAWLEWWALSENPQELSRRIAKWRLGEIDHLGNAHARGNSSPHRLLHTLGCNGRFQKRFLYAVGLPRWEGAIQGRVWMPDKACGVHDFQSGPTGKYLYHGIL